MQAQAEKVVVCRRSWEMGLSISEINGGLESWTARAALWSDTLVFFSGEHRCCFTF